eukprot:TRINITY_DN79961_c0_g1_i1.p1 TRINITY_DN79961_c0_g1~~TRINITY_DN79961_c0_g1_i1.p1  ORF type:complete len:594 (-),score=138.46 TRINITY_DN79961_c0_g1_i1:394-2175(-)
MGDKDGHSFMKSAGNPASTAAAAAAAANAAAPARSQPATVMSGMGYAPEAPFLGDLSSPVKVEIGGGFGREKGPSPASKSKGGGRGARNKPNQSSHMPFSGGGRHQVELEHSPYFPPPPAFGMFDQGVHMSPYGMAGMFPPAPNPFTGMPWGIDPNVAGGGMPGMPGMYAGMGMPPMGGYPGGMMAMHTQQASHQNRKGKGGQGNNSAKARKDKRTKKNANRGDDFPEADDEINPNWSPALQEVRRSGIKCKLTLKEVLPHFQEFAYDQQGSKFLQMKLDEAKEEDKDAVCKLVCADAPKLTSNVFGNFLVQKVFDIGTSKQKGDLAASFKSEVVRLSSDEYGCRVIQKAIQNVCRESQLIFATELQGSVIQCIESAHGNHVIQKCIEQMPPDSVNFIIQELETDTQRMANHMYGCRVIQRLLEHCSSNQLQGILDELLGKIADLSQNSYGNYVVQHMLEHGRKEDKQTIIRSIATGILDFSKHKCSSNVVEKCFEAVTTGEHAQSLEEERNILMKSVLGNQGDENPALLQMMDDRFGNYIVQKMLEHSRGTERELLRTLILGQEPLLRASSNGKHILSALQKEVDQAKDTAS